jgi:iron complex outermembrane receptor protein
VPGPITATSADVAGNAQLKPEVANGLELAYERYLPTNGVVSANLFTRRLDDVIRTVTALEEVSWATSPRWVTRPQNLGSATTRGIELDAKFSLRELDTAAPPVNVRANISLFRSSVDGVPGPDNRLAGQPDMTGNLGADYRFRGTPLSVGGSVNWTPAYDIRQTAEQLERISRKVVTDAYLAWNFDAATKLRLSFTSTSPRDFQTNNIFLAGNELQQVVDTRRGYLVSALRLEMRL